MAPSEQMHLVGRMLLNKRHLLGRSDVVAVLELRDLIDYFKAIFDVFGVGKDESAAHRT